MARRKRSRKEQRAALERAQRLFSEGGIIPDISISRRGRVQPIRIPRNELDAQAARLSAYAARDLTARIFNDPPAGMSALDAREE